MTSKLYVSVFIFGVFFSIFNESVGQNWSTFVDNTVIFSSPRVIDLNGDEVLDVVVGDGIEDSIRGSVRAFNGLDGSSLWSVDVDGDIFGSAMFYDVSGDQIADIFIGGRDRQFHAINGQDGTIIWSFDTTQSAPPGIGWMQFYNSQLIPDIDGDDLMDLVVTNGGNPAALAGEGPRYPGWLLAISSATGELLNAAVVPDSAETYCSLVIADIENNGEFDIVFGTGGETFPGSLWRTTLSDLLSNDISSAIQITENDTHGYVAAPVLADIDNDNVLDIITADAEGRVAAYNGIDNQTMWTFQLPVTECYSTPAVGQFTGSNHLDVYANIGSGVWPFFNKYYQVLINGETGEVEYLDSIGQQFSSPLAYDFDNDGYDEALLSSNATSIFSPNTYSVLMVDFNDVDTVAIFQQQNAVSGASTPWIGDLDGDGIIDMVFAMNTGVSFYSYSLQRQTLPFTLSSEMKWGAYHGSDYNGVYDFLEQTPVSTTHVLDTLLIDVIIWPNPSTEWMNINGIQQFDNLEIMDARGMTVLKLDLFRDNKGIDVSGLASGMYTLIAFRNGICSYGKFIKR